MAVVEDYYIGKTHVQICDDCIVKTQEEVDQILEDIGKILTQHEIRRMLAKE